MHFHVLHAQQAFVEPANVLKEATAPDRTGYFPDHFERQEAQQVIPGV